MQDSIFTKIINGEIPGHKVYEDEHTYAFLDIHPITRGHTLVVPKKQVEFLWDLEDNDYHNLQSSAKKIALHLRTALNVPYVGVQVVGVDVPHAHIHLIPFTNASEYHGHPSPDTTPNHEELAKTAAQIALT